MEFDFFDSVILVFLKLFSSENYSDDFEDEDIDAPLAPKEETNSKENSKSEKINVPKQVCINYMFDSLETSFITLADCCCIKSSKYRVLYSLAHCCKVIGLLILRRFLNSGVNLNLNEIHGS